MLFPRTCPVCGRVGDAPCARCCELLEPAPALPAPPGLVACHAAFACVGAGRQVVARLKYRNNRSASGWLARQMAERVAVGGPRPALVAWAPTTPQHRRERGFDHAELLARGVARELHLPARRLLTRLPGPAQTGRSRADRRRGPRFAPAPRLASRGPGAGRGGARTAWSPVLLVDDVSTTGATLTCAARVLHGVGVAEVIGLVAARTP